ncbi:dihydroorotate oxidase [Blattabacterium cuenoti]|uniref:dihydroorotate oxidase n=1 Tax=Blattabacterium cuenoti TaxID=1653831 RepID=UPI00163C57F6|nr:dihydroorotate oxidase [Blattabacterium cuenoti]
MMTTIEDIDISTNINGIQLDSCIMNASGIFCSTEKELNILIQNSYLGAVVTKSCTLKTKTGNPFPRCFQWGAGSINSVGLANLGIDFYLSFLKTTSLKKPIFLSLSGSSFEENYMLLKKTNPYSDFISAIELNLSCPNILGDKKVLGYDFHNMPYFLDRLFNLYNNPLGIKLPPYFNEYDIAKLSSILNKYPVDFVTCVNSLPNGLFINVEKETIVIKPNKGFGGIGGLGIKPFALSNVRQFYNYLRKDISVIGCGGIKYGTDIFEHILCGASAVQIGTQFLIEGISVFHRLLFELIELLQNKNYFSLKEFKGKLRTINN